MQQKITALKEVLGIYQDDELEIVKNREYLQQQRTVFYESIELWLNKHTLITSSSGKKWFVEEFYENIISAHYDRVFYSKLYRQTLHWYRLGLTDSKILLLYNQIRQLLLSYTLRINNSRLSYALCQIVDLSISLSSEIYQINYKMQSIKYKVEHDIKRAKQTYGFLADNLSKDMLADYIYHQSWKSVAISLALGNQLELTQKPLPLDRCHLTRWLYLDANEGISLAERKQFESAYRKTHEVIEIITQQRAQHKPEQISVYLSDLDQASDIVSYILSKCLDKAIINLASYDQLTKLRNRTTMHMAFQQQQSLAQRLGLQVGIVLLDIDYFKKVNDKYGHLIGDVILIEMSELIKQLIRCDDMLFRWGGEEFLILGLVNKTAAQGIMLTAERIRNEVEKTVFNKQGEAIRLTVSAGVIEYHASIDFSWTDIFALADKLLYQAKEQGRNQITYAKL